MSTADIDLEAEYNNRARVPEHPEIFERWRRAAEDFRNRMAADGRAALAIPYGNTPRQAIDLFAAKPEAGRLAVFIHGGYWRSLEPQMFSHLAGGLLPSGISVAFIGYDLCPRVPVPGIVAQIRQACAVLWRRFARPMFVYGHSAGGHLAACALATDWRALGLPERAVPAATAISGVFDLTALVGLSMNADLRLDPLEARRVSPLFWPAPKDRSLDLIVGADESREFLRQSREISEAWGRAGVRTRYEEAPGNHFTVLDAFGDPQSEASRRLARLIDTALG